MGSKIIQKWPQKSPNERYHIELPPCAGEEALPQHALTPLDDEAGALGAAAAAEGNHGQTEQALRESGEQQLWGRR